MSYYYMNLFNIIINIYNYITSLNWDYYEIKKYFIDDNNKNIKIIYE